MASKKPIKAVAPPPKAAVKPAAKTPAVKTVKVPIKPAPKAPPTKVGVKAKADAEKAAKVRATLPPKNVKDEDVVDLAKSISAFQQKLQNAWNF